MKRHWLIVASTLALLFTLAAAASAQSDRGAIVGTVRDPNGAVVANAKVTVTNSDNGQVHETTTSSEGTFSVLELKAAPYRLTVEATGFKAATIEKVQVGVQMTSRADVKLVVGDVDTQSVTVTSESSLQAESPVIQTNVSERQVRELPLQIGGETAGRSPLSFIFLDSSVTAGGGTTGQQNESARASGTLGYSFRINGGQALGTEILMALTRRAEMAPTLPKSRPDQTRSRNCMAISASTWAEFAPFWRVVNFTIKSGGNKFHGEGYEFLRNEALNANIDLNRLNGGTPCIPSANVKCEIPRPLDRQHDFGFSIGGPIYLPHFGEGGSMVKGTKNRAFFFFNYGGYRLSQSETVDVGVPTAKMRTGDFSELLTDPSVVGFFGAPVQIFDNSVPCCNRPLIPGNRLDLYRNAAGQSIIDPAGFNLLQLFPSPTQPGVFHNYRATTQRPQDSDYYAQEGEFCRLYQAAT
jgi:hypothetical protein